MSFPYAKDTELKWRMIAFTKQLTALLELPERFDTPRAAKELVILGNEMGEIHALASYEAHIDTRMMYLKLLDGASDKLADLCLLFITFTLRAIGDRLEREAPELLDRLQRAHKAFVLKDWVAMKSLVDEITAEKLASAPPPN